MALGLSGGEDRKKTVLLVGGFGLIAVVAVGLAIHGFLGDDEVSDDWHTVHFLCLSKGEHFTRRQEDLPRDYLDQRNQMKRVFLDCPLCGKAKEAAPAIHCPNTACRKFYAVYMPTEDGQGVKDQTQCPHCGVKPHEWDRDHHDN